MSQRHGWHLSVLAVVLELELEHVLLDLRVPERLQYPSSVGAQEVVAHVGVEIEVVGVIEEIPLLGRMLELLVVVVDDAHPVSLAVRQVAWQVAADSCPKKGWDPPGGWQMVLVDVIQYLLIF